MKVLKTRTAIGLIPARRIVTEMQDEGWELDARIPMNGRIFLNFSKMVSPEEAKACSKAR